MPHESMLRAPTFLHSQDPKETFQSCVATQAAAKIRSELLPFCKLPKANRRKEGEAKTQGIRKWLTVTIGPIRNG